MIPMLILGGLVVGLIALFVVTAVVANRKPKMTSGRISGPVDHHSKVYNLTNEKPTNPPDAYSMDRFPRKPKPTPISGAAAREIPQSEETVALTARKR